MIFKKLSFWVISLLFLVGCGTDRLDATSSETLQSTFAELKGSLTESQAVVFDLAYNQLMVELYDQVRKGKSESLLRQEFFGNKTALDVINQARSVNSEKIALFGKDLRVATLCYKSSKDGLKISDEIVKSSSIKPEERVELTFSLYNGSNYPISAVQANISLQIFGAPGMEKNFIGKDYVTCRTDQVIKPTKSGSVSCVLNYEMGTVRYEGPAKDLQLFSIEIFDTDSKTNQNKKDPNTMAACKESMDKAKEKLNEYTNNLEKISSFK